MVGAKRIVVTGGCGFIGSAVIRLLLDETDRQILNIDKLTYAANQASIPGAVANPNYRFAEADVADSGAMGRLFEEYQPDAVMHRKRCSDPIFHAFARTGMMRAHEHPSI
jgi:dTDP-glucose 4,6-dehydratase